MHGDVWFFAAPERWSGTTVTLDRDETHHAVRVLRVAPPDVVTVTDGRGRVARCSVREADDAGLVAEVLESDHRRVTVPQIVVYQGAAKGNKNDDVVEKIAELGVLEFTVFESRRSVVRWDDKKIDRLHERWNDIARSAAKQSHNAHALLARGVVGWDDLLRSVRQEPLAVALWESADLPLRTALVEGAPRVALIVGPEGGFDEAEAAGLAEAGAQLVSLGPRILRTENAAPFTTAAVQYHYGVFG